MTKVVSALVGVVVAGCGASRPTVVARDESSPSSTEHAERSEPEAPEAAPVAPVASATSSGATELETRAAAIDLGAGAPLRACLAETAGAWSTTLVHTLVEDDLGLHVEDGHGRHAVAHFTLENGSVAWGRLRLTVDADAHAFLHVESSVSATRPELSAIEVVLHPVQSGGRSIDLGGDVRTIDLAAVVGSSEQCTAWLDEIGREGLARARRRLPRRCAIGDTFQRSGPIHRCVDDTSAARRVRIQHATEDQARLRADGPAACAALASLAPAFSCLGPYVASPSPRAE